MIEELQQVDISILNSLVDLRRERDALRQRLARMKESADQVSDQVLSRVRNDYETRIAALDAKAAPLKDEARATYGRLKPLLAGAEDACKTLRLDQEELELRHRLGEFDDEAHRNREEQLGESLRDAESRAAEISQLVDRFVGAFDSPEELAPPVVSPSGLPAGEIFASKASDAAIAVELGVSDRDDESHESHESHESDDSDEEDGTLMLPPDPPAAAAPPPPVDPPPNPPSWIPKLDLSLRPDFEDATGAPRTSEPPLPRSSVAVAAARLAQESAGGSGGFAAEPAGGTAGGSETATRGLVTKPPAAARLEALDADLDPQPHYLEPLTFIGRTPENQVRIYKPAVSRRHAQLTETPNGWLLRDLSSENGTYVNGQRITERLLAEGDRVQFGTSRFVLRLSS
ncbi:MAG: FHA domain-containing protein [Thermoanaerobaculia bacterium]